MLREGQTKALQISAELAAQVGFRYDMENQNLQDYMENCVYCQELVRNRETIARKNVTSIANKASQTQGTGQIYTLGL